MKTVRILTGVACLIALAGLSGCGGSGSGSDGKTALYTVSGQLTTPEFAVRDADVPVEGALTPGNNTDAEAQPLPNPFVVGGYVSPAAQDSGTLHFPQDTADIYRVYLHQDDSVRLDYFSALSSASPGPLSALTLEMEPEADAASGKQTDGAAGSPLKLTAQVAGYHLIRIRLNTGTTPVSYVLSLGGTGTSTAASRYGGLNFVPGEALVQFRGDVPAMRALGSGVEVIAGDTRFGFHVRQPGVVRSLSAAGDLSARLSTLAWIESLRTRPDVAWAEPNYLRRAAFVPNDPLYADYQWALSESLNMASAWDRIPAPGEGAVVAVIDSGIVKSHPELAGQLVEDADMYDFVSAASLDLDETPGRDPDPSDPGDKAYGTTSSFHGTLVAGVIAALTDNARDGASVASHARIMPLRVLGKNGEGTDADIIEAIKFAAGLPNASGRLPSRPADVINLSLGQATPDTALQNAIDQVAALPDAPIIVAAAGNEATSVPFYPAAYDNVISVSALTRDNTLATYSNYGSTIDVAAPGGDTADPILTTGAVEQGGGLYTGPFLASGTSIAAPHVSAVAAMLRAKRGSSFGPQAFRSLLADITDDLGDPLRFGAGRINADKAALKALDPDAELVSADVTRLLLGSPTDTATFTLSWPSGRTPVIDSVTPTTLNGGDWLSVEEVGTNADGSVTWRAGVKPGTELPTDTRLTGVIDIVTPNNTLRLTVNYLQTTAAIAYGDVGTVYVQLRDTQDDSRVYEVAVATQEGSPAAFSLSGIPAGTYILLASTDRDGDNVIAEDGEAVALYPVTTDPQELTIGSSLTGLSLGLSYRTPVASSAGSGIPTALAP